MNNRSRESTLPGLYSRAYPGLEECGINAANERCAEVVEKGNKQNLGLPQSADQGEAETIGNGERKQVY